MEVSNEYKDSKMIIGAFFYKNYFKKTFSNSFTLDELKELSSYYKQFNSEKEIINEIINNKLKGKETIEGNEETSNSIILIIPLPGTQFPKISFELKQVEKTPEEILNEYKYIINQYENKFRIKNFNSKILAGKDLEKETLKFWISPQKNFEAILLFSFHDIKYERDKSSYSNYIYKNIHDKNVNNFHKACDNISSILVICKSRKEILGGYTPLCFKSSDVYGSDNDSFLFSLNKFKKYPKDSYNTTNSLWCYENYGPCFHWDLYFRENKINAVKFEKKSYLTPENWIDTKNCYVADEGILLDSLEVFQIIDISNRQNNNPLSSSSRKDNNKQQKKIKKDKNKEEKKDKQLKEKKDEKNIINEEEKNKNEKDIEENKIKGEEKEK